MAKNHFIRLMVILLAGFQIAATTDDFYDSVEVAIQGKDYRRAINLLQPLAEDGYPRAQIILGDIFKTAPYPTQNFATSVKWYHLAADNGNADAQVKLGQMYERGQGVPIDQDVAVTWYRKAAESGQTDIQLKLAHMYERGDMVQQNLVEASNWYRKAAESGNAEAQFQLARAYAQATPPDFERALEWYHKAANQGEFNAQFHLGEMYARGLGMEPDTREAVKWFQLAAEGGQAHAQLNLGLIYGLGEKNMPRDYPTAYMWLNLAAAALPAGPDRDKAVTVRDDIAGKLTPSQLAASRSKTREWRPVKR